MHFSKIEMYFLLMFELYHNSGFMAATSQTRSIFQQRSSSLHVEDLLCLIVEFKPRFHLRGGSPHLRLTAPAPLR